MYHTTERHNWLGVQEEEFDQGDRNKAFEACKIITAANIWNLKYGHAFKFEHKWQVFDMERGIYLDMSTVGAIRQLKGSQNGISVL